ncbi:hypothetical protein LCGC14_2896960, partial [marine sediment metagenome]
MPRYTKDQCVYLFTTPNGYCKVGIAKDPEKRVRELQCGCPETISFHGATLLRADGMDPREMERVVHSVLRPYRSSGEWFKITVADAIRAFGTAWDVICIRDPSGKWKHYEEYQ